jgi:hypothetical protein
VFDICFRGTEAASSGAFTVAFIVPVMYFKRSGLAFKGERGDLTVLLKSNYCFECKLNVLR